MTVEALAKLTDAKILTGDVSLEREVGSGFCCDLLSWVMGHGVADMALVTVQTHMNVIAVCTLLDIACLVVPEGIAVPEDVAERAAEEGVAIIASPLPAYEICGRMAAQGVPPARK